MYKLDDILKWTNGKLIKKVNTEFDQIEVDTRNLVENSLFITTKGINVDTNNFISEALEKGATGIMFSDIYKYKEYCKENGDDFTAIQIDSNHVYDSFGLISKRYLEKLNCEVICVTGTAGKSTTIKLINHFLSQKYNVISTEEVNNGIEEVGRAILKLDENSNFAVLELGLTSSPTNGIKYTLDIVKSKVKVGIIKNISNNHASIGGGIDEIIRQKSTVVTSLGEGQIGILNADDPSTEGIIKQSKCKIITFGTNNKADVMAKDIEVKNFSTEFTLVVDGEEVRAESPILGSHNVYNVLAAVACVINKGVSLEEIASYLKTFKPVKMRMESIILNNGVRLISDTYNNSLISMKGAIDTLNKFDTKRSIMLMGGILDVGSYTDEIHKEISEYVETRMPDILITYGDTGKSINEYLSDRNSAKENCLYHCESNSEVINILENIMQDGDTILLKGSHYYKFGDIVDYFIKTIGKR